VVDPDGTAKHGDIIYIFRNTKTNQIIYSLQELLDVRHCNICGHAMLTCAEPPSRTASLYWQALQAARSTS
jgi:hypothetical protein